MGVVIGLVVVYRRWGTWLEWWRGADPTKGTDVRKPRTLASVLPTLPTSPFPSPKYSEHDSLSPSASGTPSGHARNGLCQNTGGPPVQSFSSLAAAGPVVQDFHPSSDAGAGVQCFLDLTGDRVDLE